MPSGNLYRDIKKAIETAPRNNYSSELHLQVIKYSDLLENVTGKEFCANLDIPPSFGTEFSKMKKIAGRLRKAGLDPDRI
jgi:hypothetical protein